ncbi:Zn(II)2Cys6 transcription factor [Aspergillus affinis]|uniref:Zn(II)2Cys6 transcription factor n=1 Tax=Aspergillus affinis TaxID=1070780 RepID=UPI0022FEB4A6|nr:uncharacterized protein KD926_003387 [Aspergillus affinis]KAI9043617.1 hypothetical protein KD926_003387 [Aspergillus affinis]
MMFSFHTGRASPQDQASRESRPKRAKTRIACNVCKARKTKCDGARPICGPCSRRKQTSHTTNCIYRETDSDEQPRDTSERLASDSPQVDDDDGASSYSAFAPTGGLFGASSGAHVLQNVGNETGLPNTPTGQGQSRSQVLPKALKRLPKLQNQRFRKDPPDLQFAIPPRKQADHLLSLYWDYVDSVYPWLDRPLIENAYETLWVKDGELTMNETVLHCLLNLMFATSCVASQGEPPLARYQSSVVFFERAQALMSYQLMDLYNFEIIQVLLLTAVYLQHEKEPQKCFRIIGTAIHVAQELGLHIPETTAAMDSPKERDLARQVWNGCVVMDRICAMTFGCPLKVPQFVAEQGLKTLALSSMEVSSETVTTSLPSKYNFYVSFCRLHHIISEVLETFYISGDNTNERQPGRDSKKREENSSSLFFDKFASLFRIESALNDWAHVYMAVTNLLAAQSSPQIVEYFSVVRLQGILEQARGILKDYEKHAPLASRCSSVLKVIEQNMGRRESVADLASLEAPQFARGNDNTSARDFVPGTQEPQTAMVDDLTMVENYTFDWNEWPMFFAQLDGDTAPIW